MSDIQEFFNSKSHSWIIGFVSYFSGSKMSEDMDDVERFDEDQYLEGWSTAQNIFYGRW
jgi:hypothetical protein